MLDGRTRCCKVQMVALEEIQCYTSAVRIFDSARTTDPPQYDTASCRTSALTDLTHTHSTHARRTHKSAIHVIKLTTQQPNSTVTVQTQV